MARRPDPSTSHNDDEGALEEMIKFDDEHRLPSEQTARRFVEPNDHRSYSAGGRLSMVRRPRRSTIRSNDTVTSFSPAAYDLYTDALEDADQQTQIQRESLLPDALASKSKEKAAQFVFSGSFLPLMNDKARNNVKNRFLLALVYAVGAAFVALLVILLFEFDSNDSWSMSFAVPPPAVAYIGSPFDDFVVRVEHKQTYEGIQGVGLHAYLVPVSDVEVQVFLSGKGDGGTFSSHTINCPAILGEPRSWKHTDRLLCQPFGSGLGQFYESITDIEGMARFTNLTLGAGLNTNYVLLVFDSSTTVSISSVVKIIATPYQPPSVNQNNGVESYLIRSAPNTTKSVPFSESLSFSVTAIWWAPKPPTFVCAVLMAIDAQGFISKSIAVPAPLNGSADTAFTLSQYSVCLGPSSIQWVNATTGLDETTMDSDGGEGESSSSSSGSNPMDAFDNLIQTPSTRASLQLYNATFNFSGVFFHGSNTGEPYVAVNVVGHVLPITSLPGLLSEYQRPSEIVLPFSILTDVARVVATGVPSMVQEGTPLENITVIPYDSDGNVVPSKEVYLYLLPSPDNGTTVDWGCNPSIFPGVVPKRILHRSFPAPVPTKLMASSPVVMYPMFTVSGRVGHYRLIAVVDGVKAAWPDNNNRMFLNVYISSSVSATWSRLSWMDDSSVALPANASLGSEKLGFPWVAVPMVRVVDHKNNSIVGKYVTLSPVNRTSSAIVYSGYESIDNGFATLFTVVTPFCEGGAGVIWYDVFVDDVWIANFSRSLTIPSKSDVLTTLNQELFSSEQDELELADNFSSTMAEWVQVVTAPSRLYADVPQNMTFRVLALDGTPVPFNRVNFSVPSQYLPPLNSSSSIPFVSDANGELTLPISLALSNIIGGSYVVFFPTNVLQTKSGKSKTMGSYPNNFGGVSWTRVGPVANHSKDKQDNRSMWVDFEFVDWDLVNESNPLMVGAQLNWYPSFTSLWYTLAQFPTVPAVKVVNASQLPVRLTFDKIAGLPGLYGFTPTVGSSEESMVPVPPWRYIGFSSNISRLVLLQSAFSGPPINGSFGDPNTSYFLEVNEIFGLGDSKLYQPVIQILDQYGQPMENMSVFAQPVFHLPDGQVIPLDLQIDPQNIRYGILLLGSEAGATYTDFANLANLSLSKAVSNRSNSNGVAGFVNLSIVALDPTVNMTIRYCVASHTKFDTKDVDFLSFCVNDTGGVARMAPQQQQVSYSIAGTTLFATPGNYIPDIVVSTAGSSSTPHLIMCIPFIGSSPNEWSQTILAFEQTVFLPYGSFLAEFSPTLPIRQQIALIPSAPTRTHYIRFACAGGVTNSAPIVISSTPTNIIFSEYKFQIPIGQVSAVRVLVAGAGGESNPLAGVPVQLSIESTDPTCYATQCGLLYGTSLTMALSDSSGISTFIIGFTGGRTANYAFTATVIDINSAVAVRSVTRAQTAAVLADLGLPRGMAQAYWANVEQDVSILNAIGDLTEGLESMLTGLSLPQPASNMLQAMGISNTRTVTATMNNVVFNAITSTVIVYHMPVRVRLPSSSTIVNNFVGVAPTMFQFGTDEQPFLIVQFYNASQNYFYGGEISLDVDPPNAPITLRYPSTSSDPISKINGTASLNSIQIFASQPATFRFFVSGSGGGGNFTDWMFIEADNTFSRSEIMKLLAGMLVVYFSPMLASSVPHSRAIYLYLGLISVVGSIVLLSWADDYIPKNTYARGYYVFLFVMISVLGVMALAVVVIDTMARRLLSKTTSESPSSGKEEGPSCGVKKTNTVSGPAATMTAEQIRRDNARVWHPALIINSLWLSVNDERRALRMMRYAEWITNSRARRVVDLEMKHEASEDRRIAQLETKMRFRRATRVTEMVRELERKPFVDPWTRRCALALRVPEPLRHCEEVVKVITETPGASRARWAPSSHAATINGDEKHAALLTEQRQLSPKEPTDESSYSPVQTPTSSNLNSARGSSSFANALQQQQQLQQQQLAERARLDAERERQEAEEDRIREMILADTFLSQKKKLAKSRARASWKHKLWNRVNLIVGNEIVDVEESETDTSSSDEDDTASVSGGGHSSSSGGGGVSLTSPIHEDESVKTLLVDDDLQDSASVVKSKKRRSRKKRTRKNYCTRPTLIYPQHVLDVEPLDYPFNFIIVVAVSFVFLIIMVFLVLFVYQELERYAQVLLSYLPSAQGGDGLTASELQEANNVLVSIVTEGITFIVINFPSLYSLSKLLQPVKDFNAIRVLIDIHSAVQEAVRGVMILFGVAGGIATLSVIVSIWLTAREIPVLIRTMRRGKLTVAHNIKTVETYIGLHCFHMVLLHQLVFWLLVIIGTLLAVDRIRLYLWTTLQVFMVASTVSYFIQFGLQRILVQWFLTDGRSLILRPELYALWHFAGLILGIFTGLIKSVVRWLFALLAITAMFSRLDRTIFPPSLAFLDQAHFGFMSVVTLEAKNGNPIMLLFATFLLLEKEMQHLGDEDAMQRLSFQRNHHVESQNARLARVLAANHKQRDLEEGGGGDSSAPPPPVPNPHHHSNEASSFRETEQGIVVTAFGLFDHDHCMSAAVKNCARIIAYEWYSTSVRGLIGDVSRFANGTSCARSRRMRIQQRFWLWMLMTLNPTLIRERKHNLYEK